MADENKKSIPDIVRESMTQPKSMEVDGQKIDNHPINDLVRGARYLASVDQARNPLSAVRIARARGNSAV